MKVKNGSCIRRLSFKTLMAARKRNIIAVLAIALTALLFTSLFTIVMLSLIHILLMSRKCFLHDRFCFWNL